MKRKIYGILAVMICLPMSLFAACGGSDKHVCKFDLRQAKDEYFSQDTWMLIPDGINGMCGSFMVSDIDNATIVYDEDTGEFHVAFVNQDEMFDEGFEHFKRIQFLYTKKALN